MLRSFSKAFFLLACLLATPVLAQTVPSAGQGAAFIRVGLPAATPFGWADFCQRYPGECAGGTLAPVDIDSSRANLSLIDRVNRFVNLKVQPKADAEQWNVVDRWDFPTGGAGDCEDFVLLKRKILIDSGLPRQALLVTIVRDARNEGHAVLTVRTKTGDIILDNMNDQMKRWNETDYRFIKRQSQEDQNAWISIGAPDQPHQMVAR